MRGRYAVPFPPHATPRVNLHPQPPSRAQDISPVSIAADERRVMNFDHHRAYVSDGLRLAEEAAAEAAAHRAADAIGPAPVFGFVGFEEQFELLAR
jgi:hypothetical protein